MENLKSDVLDKSTIKYYLVIIMAVIISVLICGNISIQCKASDNIVTGKCGENVSYIWNKETGDVVISGSGAMQNYTSEDNPFSGGNVKSVVFYNGITSVGDYTFYGCYDLEKVSFSDSITDIGQYAFAFCFSIERMIIPDSIMVIGDRAFFSCQGMKAIWVSANVSEIGQQAIGYYCGNGTSGSIEKQRMWLYGYKDSIFNTYISDNNLYYYYLINDIPDKCGDDITYSLDIYSGKLSVTGTGAMYDYESGYSKNSIGNFRYAPYATSPFYMLRNWITSVEFDNTITNIGDYSFYMCEFIKEIRLPDGMKAINKNAFEECSLLSEVHIPKSIDTISDKVFRSCKNLSQINVAEDNADFMSQDGILYSKDETTLYWVPAHNKTEILVLPDALKYINWGACSYNINLKTIVFPDNFKYIDYYNFYDMISLHTLVFKGDAPRSDMGTFYIGNCDIYYSKSKSGWDNFKNKYKFSGEVTWKDLDDYSKYSCLFIENEVSYIEVGDSIQLGAKINPLLASDFEWECKDSSAAYISANGKFTALKPGNITVSVKSTDGKYSAQKVITVIGNVYERPGYQSVKLDNGEIDYSSYKICRQIPCSEKNGIYFLNDTVLSFYSLVNQKLTKVYEFIGCEDAYAESDKLYVADEHYCYIYDLRVQQLISVISIPEYSCTAVGADSQGRVYVGVNNWNSNKVMLYSESGELLGQGLFPTSIYHFAGFNNDNGNFFVEAYYDFLYWGYNHPGKAVYMGNVSDNIIKYLNVNSSQNIGGLLYSFDCMQYLCQSMVCYHQCAADMLANKYLVTYGTALGKLQIIDSGTDTLDTVFSSDISSLIDNKEAIDVSSVGVRTVYCGNNSVITYEEGKKLVEYNLESGRETGEFTTQYSVFSLSKMGDTVVAVEKEDDSYYMEIINWSQPDSVNIIAEKSSMIAGENQKLSIQSDTEYIPVCIWSSSDNRIATVSDSGVVAAWHEGTVTIYCKSDDGRLESNYTITVIKKPEIVYSSKTQLSNSSRIVNNISRNNYKVWSSVVNSYLVENDDNTFTRIENTNDGIVAEKFYKSGELISSKNILKELEYFGGFYNSSDSYYIVFGQNNPAQNDECEVMRIVKYDKEWNRVKECSVYGANTYMPFDAGSLRMTETNGRLYIYTCHEMYSSGGSWIHHQANMTYVLNESDMQIEQSYYDVLNIAQAGYVSHSFNQFIKTDGDYIYRVDHGDGAPRAVSITKCDVLGKITDVKYTYALSIGGKYGENATGVSVGGFELSTDNCLIAGNSVDQSDAQTYSAYGQRNIFITVTDKDLDNTEVKWLTKYAEKDNITPYTPQLIKNDDEHFLVMWEERNNISGQVKVRMVTVNEKGEATSPIITSNMNISDCHPIFSSDGIVRWCVSDDSNVYIYAVDPYRLEDVSETKGHMIIDDNEYYYDEITGAAYNGWLTIDGKDYWYEDAVRQGYNVNDISYRGKEIYDPASNAWYWLDNVQNGAVAKSKDVYQESAAGAWADNKVYNEDGSVNHDASTGKWVRYDENGHMIKGWHTNDAGTYYFDTIYGTMAKGHVVIGDNECYFDKNTGIGYNGWLNVDGINYWYENGIRQGYNVNDASYRGKEIYDPASDAWYWLDNVQNGAVAKSKDVYQESYAGVFADRPDGTGKWVRYDENGHMIKGWSEMNGNTYYFDYQTGAMAKGWVNIDGVEYYFNKETGVRE